MAEAGCGAPQSIATATEQDQETQGGPSFKVPCRTRAQPTAEQVEVPTVSQAMTVLLLRDMYLQVTLTDRATVIAA